MNTEQIVEVLAKQNDPQGRFYYQYRPDFELTKPQGSSSVELQDAWIDGVELNNLGDLNRLYFLVLNVRALLQAEVPGAFAELGVYKGNSARLMRQLAPRRELFLFDTFEGFDRGEAHEDTLPTSPSRFDDTSLEHVRGVVGEDPHTHYCVGRFPETWGLVPESQAFAFVHLDCDLYAPMKSGLEAFYPRLSPGGMLVIHDYGSGCWPGVKRAVDEYLEDKPETLIHIPDKSGTVVLTRNRVPAAPVVSSGLRMSPRPHA